MENWKQKVAKCKTFLQPLLSCKAAIQTHNAADFLSCMEALKYGRDN